MRTEYVTGTGYRPGCRWPDEWVDLGRRMWLEGASASRIADALGSGVTRNAVLGMVFRRRWEVPGTKARSAPRKKGGAHPWKRLGETAVVRRAVAAAPQRKPEPVAVVPVEIISTPVEFEYHRDGMCRWPLGDPQTEEFRFCGAVTSRRYCEGHRQMSLR